MCLKRSGHTPKPEDATGSRSKKRPAFGDIRSIAEAWCKEAAHNKPHRRVAEELSLLAGHLQPRQLNSLLANQLIQNWKGRFARATCYQWRNLLKRLLATLETFGAPHIQIDRVPTPRPKTRTASPEELAALLKTAPAHMRLFVLLCWKLGLRHRAAWDVSPSSYDREHQTILITTKNKKSRTIPVTPDIATLIEAASLYAGDPTESCVSLLRRGSTTKPMSHRTMHAAWLRLCKKAGVEELTPHDLRRTVANSVMNATHDLRAVQFYLGHESLASTMHYIAPFTEEKLRDLQTLLNFHSEVKQ